MLKRLRVFLATVIIFAALSVLMGCGRGMAGDGAALTMRILNTGKSDCILLVSGENAVMVDAADEDDGPYILRLLNRYDIQELDALILTHYDKDHIGGAAELIRSVKIDRIIGPDYAKDSDAFAELTAALSDNSVTLEKLGDDLEIQLGEAVLNIDVPLKEYDNSNNNSLIVRVDCQGCGLLLLGDAMAKRIAEYNDGMTVDLCGLVKLPHHGDYSDELGKLLAVVKPAYAVETVSEEETVDGTLSELLSQMDTRLLKSCEGEITAFVENGTLSVLQ